MLRTIFVIDRLAVQVFIINFCRLTEFNSLYIAYKIGIVTVIILQQLVVRVLFNLEFIAEKRKNAPDKKYALIILHRLKLVNCHKLASEDTVIFRSRTLSPSCTVMRPCIYRLLAERL